MATLPQASANQLNAQLSTGPRTPEGQAAASQNARKHGLSPGFSVLPNEDQTEFDSLLEAYSNDFGFNSEHEWFLVEQMAQSRWKHARIQRLETAVCQRVEATGAPEDWKALVILQRYAAATERSYYKAHRELMEGRKESSKQISRQAKTDGAALNSFIEAYINAPMPGQSAPSNVAPIRPATTEAGRSAPSAKGA